MTNEEKRGAKCPLQVGDLIRFDDATMCNTLYRVLKVKLDKVATEFRGMVYPPKYRVTYKPVFGLYKDDYKLTKNTLIDGGPLYRSIIKVDLMDLLMARNRVDLFIQKETKRFSGEK